MTTAAEIDEEDALPVEVPTAPTQEAWARMGPAEQARAVDALFASVSQEEIAEREAMAEGDPHLDAKVGIRNTLRNHFGRLGRRIYVGADIKMYYPGQKGFTPDVIAVADVDPRPRDGWVVTAEGKGVDLAFEVHYRGDWRKDFVTNVTRFARVGIQEYFAYDILGRVLRGYRLPRAGAAYAPIPSRGGRLRSRVLQLDVALEEGRVRFYEGGAILVTESELVGKLEQMVDAAAARAEDQAARAARAEARLGAAVLAILGVRGVAVDAAARARILGEAEAATLERWLERAATVGSCEGLFGEG